MTFGMPTTFRTVGLFGQVVFLSPPFEDLFAVIDSKRVRLSINDIASVVTSVTNDPRKYAGLA